MLIDVLNKQPIGTCDVLNKASDRTKIKVVGEILSSAYLQTLVDFLRAKGNPR